ncbi:helix-turn-helix domain-containing protein [Nitrososphaera sp.]|uniref:helix-turn-helix domain-containing protein n=1 Tax=Nitrososphaera sp. TaxID=1971748 RepID=UPI0034588E38
MSKNEEMKDDRKLGDISKRLDMIIVLMLADRGLTQSEIAKILGVSSKTIERLFASSFNKIQRNKNDKE